MAYIPTEIVAAGLTIVLMVWVLPALFRLLAHLQP